MKAYLLYGSNGESYEDYFEWVDGVYLDKEKAIKDKEKLDKKAEIDYKKDKYFAKREYWIKEFKVKG